MGERYSTIEQVIQPVREAFDEVLKKAQEVLLANVRHRSEFESMVQAVEYSALHPEIVFPGRGGTPYSCPCCRGLDAGKYPGHPDAGHRDFCPLGKLVEAVTVPVEDDLTDENG